MNRYGMLAVALTSLFAAPVGADSLTIKPGLWEMTSTSSNSMTGQSTTRTDSECFKEAQAFDPAEMAEGMDDCKMVENVRQGDSLNFRMECNVQGSAATAVGTLHTDGKTSKMNMDFLIKAGGMDMKMTIKSTGKRMGDC